MTGKPERLQKILAHAGLGSRRDCEDYILKGRVTVDGQVVRELGTKVDAEAAAIAVDGERIKLEKMVYFAVNKPKGYVSTSHDPSGRPRVIDLLPEVPERVYSVGRLDEDSMGLMILTNDGELANRLAHPRYGVEKTYRALVAGTPTREIVDKLVEGIWLSDGKVRAKRARMVGTQGEATLIEMVLAEGKKREIRRMLAKLGHKVMSLTRVSIGPVVLKGLPPGEHRPLSRAEIDLLRKVAAGLAVEPPRFPKQSRVGPRRPAEGRRRPVPETEKAGGKAPRVGAEGQHRDRAPRASRPGPSASRDESAPGKSIPGKPGTHRAIAGKPMAGKAGRDKPMPGKPVEHGRQGATPAGPKPRQRPFPGRKSVPELQPSPGPQRPPKVKAEKPTTPGVKLGRRIIGLDPKVAAEAGLSVSGRVPRTRPGIKRRPPRRASGLKRSIEGEDER